MKDVVLWGRTTIKELIIMIGVSRLPKDVVSSNLPLLLLLL